jgi:hypothetical protein
MRRLSATDAFTPALEHTKAMLAPFSLGRVLKLGLIAFLAEMSTQLFLPPMGNFAPPSPAVSTQAAAISHGMTIAFIIFGSAAFVFGLALLYFGSRLQLVLMELVATRTTLVGPSWRKQSSKTWRWIGVKVMGLLAAFIIVGIIAVFPIIHFVRSMPSNPQQPPTSAFLANFFLFFITIAAAVFMLMLAIWILRDFVMPYIVFENATMRAAIRAAIALIRRETGSVLFYLLMKIVFTMAAGLAAELLLFVGALIAAVPLGLIGAIAWFALHHANSSIPIFLYVILGMLGAIFIVWMVVLSLCAMCAVLIFYQAYALYFLGGRISALGDLLEPPPPPILEMISPPFVPV